MPCCSASLFSEFHYEAASNGLAISSSCTLVHENASQQSSVPPPSAADWDYVKPIGNGASGNVYLAIHHSTGLPAAIKTIPKSSSFANQAIIKEQYFHSGLTESMGDWVVPLQASFHDSQNFYLVMGNKPTDLIHHQDYYARGDLAYEIIRCGSFTRERATLYCAEIVLILEELHAHQIVHRDLKPSNFLIRDDGHLVISDFGLAFDFGFLRPNRKIMNRGFSIDLLDDEFVSDNGSSSSSTRSSGNITSVCTNDSPDLTTNEYAGTPYYMSPEQHCGKDYSFDADWWALGVTLYLMLTGRLPFASSSETPVEIAFSVTLDSVIFHPADKVDKQAQDLIRGLLRKERSGRLCDPCIIKSHPFFSGLDWDKVASRAYSVPQWRRFVPAVPRAISQGLADPLHIGMQFSPSTDPYPNFSWISCDLFAAAVAASDPSQSPRAKEEKAVKLSKIQWEELVGWTVRMLTSFTRQRRGSEICLLPQEPPSSSCRFI